jgi:hypothetical protein
MGENRNAYRILLGKPEGKIPPERPDAGGWIILKWILEKEDVVVGTRLIWLRIGTSEGFL